MKAEIDNVKVLTGKYNRKKEEIEDVRDYWSDKFDTLVAENNKLMTG
jgi:hypothetical protein